MSTNHKQGKNTNLIRQKSILILGAISLLSMNLMTNYAFAEGAGPADTSKGKCALRPGRQGDNGHIYSYSSDKGTPVYYWGTGDYISDSSSSREMDQCSGPSLERLNQLISSGANSGDVNSEIARVEAEQKAKNQEQDGRLNGHDTEISAIKDVNNQQNNRLDGHDTEITNIKNKNNEQDGRLNGHDTEISAIKDVNNQQNNRLDGHDTEITNIKNKNNEQDGRLNGHDTEITNIKNKNNEQDGRLNGHDTEISAIKDVNNQQNKRLDGHDTEITNIKNKNNEQDGRLNGHDTDISAIKDVNNQQNKRLDGHDTEITNIKNKNNEQDGRLDGHDTDISAIKDVNNQQNKRLDGHDTDISFLKEQDRLAVKYIPDATGAPTNVVKLTGDHSGAPVTISNVNAGVNDLDAVNKKQLDGVLAGLGGGAHITKNGSIVSPQYTVGKKNYNDVGSALSATNIRIDDLATNTNARFDRLNKRVSDVRKEARAGIAGASALAGMRYDDRPGKISLASGFGGYQDAQAMSLGLGYTTEDGVFRLNAGASYDFQGQGTVWNMGLGWTLN